MRAIRGALKTAIAVKAVDFIRREAAKPENQAKAREMARKVASEVQKRRSRGGSTTSPTSSPAAGPAANGTTRPASTSTTPGTQR